MKTINLGIFTLLACLAACSTQQPSEPNEMSVVRIDTLTAEIVDSVFLQLDSLKDSYTLEETIRGQLAIVNQSDSPYVRRMFGPPPHAFGIFRDDSLVYFYPTATGFSEWNQVIPPGSTYSQPIEWGQHLNGITATTNSQKIFSGTYRLEAWYRPGGTFVKKWFTIEETGNPLSAALERDYSPSDSIVFVFIVRNRISKDLDYRVVENPAQLLFLKNQDTVWTESVSSSVPNPLTAHSDFTIFRYSRPQSDSLFAGWSGGYTVVAKLTFEDGGISAEAFLLFL